MPEPENSIATIEFQEFQLPALKAGRYELKVTQTFNPDIEDNTIPAETISTNTVFYVAGEQFTINPTQIHSVFPPAGSLGDHALTLPHILLQSGTLLWERSIQADLIELEALKSVKKGIREGKNTFSPEEMDALEKLSIPWMALLVIHEEEVKNGQVIGPKTLKIGDLAKNDDPTRTVKFPVLDLEPGQSSEDQTMVIEVQQSLLSQILPSAEDLKYLTHVRKVVGANQESATYSTLIANRLPKSGGISTVYLVSLENRFKEAAFDFHEAKSNEFIRLICFKHWSFACIDQNQGFEGLLQNLNGYNSRSAGEIQKDAQTYTLKLPRTTKNPMVKKYFDLGYVPLLHELRNEEKSVSWYHGPLINGSPLVDTQKMSLPVLNSDQLMVYNQTLKMFDVSYGAAWQLGRMLTLKNKAVSLSIYRWKRLHTQQVCKAEQHLVDFHIPHGAEKQSLEVPANVEEWFEELKMLKHIPFNYLVPDPSMLPEESIRFFKIDPFWMECFLDGAFSIGRTTETECAVDADLIDKPKEEKEAEVSGFLMRSKIVSGWPAMQIDGFPEKSSPKNKSKVKVLRRVQLSEQVMLCLFEDEVKTVDFYIKPEAMHYAFETGNNNTTTISPRRKDGAQSKTVSIDVEVSTNRTVNI